ncbi:ATP-binding protein [Pseudalkalibacillus berkeleyi]|uniref:histidine kinase n=1 Tax=Pseudalkalibacillus berkeleyi TaxID=1069813 RepID=A0ABS9H2X9_9BACL|nr:ATP-binding protein [Pseudalkalibacillus berkeleyi]MCF6138269.1 ATP-binding protein [Pseudalkalibacillus berkeleyi]
MKRIKEYFQTSLRKQFLGLMGCFILIFLIGAALLFIYDKSITDEFESKQQQLNEKDKYSEQLNREFTKAFFDARGYIAFGRQEFKESVNEQQTKVVITLDELREISSSQEDEQFINEAEVFISFYFNELIPSGFSNFENGNIDAIIQSSTSGGTSRINEFQNQLDAYNDSIQQEIEREQAQLKQQELQNEIAFVIFVLIILFTLMAIMRMMLKQVGIPLDEVATTAEKFAEDESYNQITFDTVRKDEIGKLSVAFEKMIHTIQEKEEHLLQQNEELIAQQDELIAQQDELESQQAELEHVVEVMQNRERQLERYNQFIKGISNSLDKKEVLGSVVKSMCSVMDAARGMIVLLNDQQSHAAFGISENGVQQFIRNINDGVQERVFETKKAFSIKRHSSGPEKGYHEETQFAFDLFIPVLSVNEQVEAIMVFSRFSEDFTDEEIERYESLAKQISISLQKIHHFEESEKERETTQDILNNVQEGIQLVDHDGTNLMVNSQMASLLNVDFAELYQSTYKDWKQHFIDQVGDAVSVGQYLDSIIDQEHITSNYLTYHVPSLEKVFQVYSERLYRGDEQIGTIFVHRDITKEFEVDQMKSEFVSTVSHELRTPLSSVLGFTELMLNKELKPERQKKYLTTIYQEAKRLTALINDFLDVQRMESGRQTYEKRYENLVPIVEEVVDQQQINAPNHDITILQETEHTTTLGDRDKLSQVFTNLVSNAIKYSPDGGKVCIKFYEDHGRLKIDIQDHGLGIPADSIEKLFTKFYRVDNSDRRRIGGTGLGLAIVKEIIKAHEGTIDVNSQLGEGTTFTVNLPNTTIQLDNEEDNAANGMNILVIEDDINLASLLKTELSDSGFQVKHFKDAESGIESMKELKPDAVVLDIMLEGSMTGWDVLERMKGDQAFSAIPIIVSTALDDKEKGYMLGATEYLVKPYQPSKLSKTILQVLLKQENVGQILVPENN